MEPKNEYLNVQYGEIRTRIKVTGFEDLSEVQDIIKSKLAVTLSHVDAPFIQLYDQKGEHINKWALFKSLPDKYFDEEGLYLEIRTLTPTTSSIQGT